MKRWSLLPLAVATCLLGTARAQSYSITDLGTLGGVESRAYAVNRTGQVTGTAQTATGESRAFLWTPAAPNGASGNMQALPTLKGYSGYTGRAVNHAGDVAGTGSNGSALPLPHAFLWPAGGKAQIIGPTSGSVQTESHGINNAGQVVGWYPDKGAFLSQLVGGKRRLSIIGEGIATGINASGQVVAHHGGGEPYIWTPSVPNGPTGSKFYLPGGREANGINDAGQVAGSMAYALTVHGVTYQISHPSLYLPQAAYGLPAGLNDLGFPPPPARGEWVGGSATALNGRGTVVGVATAYDLSDPAVAPNFPQTGRTCWVWDPINGTRDLNALIADSGWVLEVVRSVNDTGQVVGEGRRNGGPVRAVLLTLR